MRAMQSFTTVTQTLFLKNFHKDGVASVTKLSKKVFSEPHSAIYIQKTTVTYLF